MSRNPQEMLEPRAGVRPYSKPQLSSSGPSGLTDACSETDLAATSVAGENIIASELDELFRTDRKLDDADFAYRRSEAARILLKSSSHNGVPAQDRDYLSVLTATITGLAPPDADARVNRAIAESKDEIHRGRVAAVLQAFMAAAALLVGFAISWFAASEGGREREAGYIPVWDWSYRRRTFS